MIKLIKGKDEWWAEPTATELKIHHGKTGRVGKMRAVPIDKCKNGDVEQEMLLRVADQMKAGFQLAPNSDPLPQMPTGSNGRADGIVLRSIPFDIATTKVIPVLKAAAPLLGLTFDAVDTVVDPRDSEQVLLLKQQLCTGYAKDRAAPMAALLAGVAWKTGVKLLENGLDLSPGDIFNRLPRDVFDRLSEIGFAPTPLKIDTTRAGARAIELF